MSTRSSVSTPLVTRKFPPYSADVNVCENVGAIAMEKVEEKLDKLGITYTVTPFRLHIIINQVMRELAADTEQLERLVDSFVAALICCVKPKESEYIL